MTSTLIDNAIEAHMGVIDRLAEFVHIVTNQLEKDLKKEGILSRVSGRIKNPESLRVKLEKYMTSPKKAKRIKSAQDLLAAIGDLAAVRVMTYMESDRPRVAEIVRKAFAHRPDHPDYEYEEKEKDPRIKNDDHNFYRATHMQIALHPEYLLGKKIRFKKDHCELQITSMLAHVWNELEHDIAYKGDKKSLSKQEYNAIESLGLLTKSGDNIIESLIEAQSVRKNDARVRASHDGEKFANAESLSNFLKNFFGEKVAGIRFDFGSNNEEFLRTLDALGWDHPSDLYMRFTPSHMAQARKQGLKFQKFLNKTGKTKPTYQMDSCDLFILAAFMADTNAIEKAFEKAHGLRREVAFFNSYKEFLAS